MLDNETKDIYALREALEALYKIPGPRSLDLLRKASRHPFPLIRQLAETLLEKRMISEKKQFPVCEKEVTNANSLFETYRAPLSG